MRALQIARAPGATDGRLVIRSSGCRSRCADAITVVLFPERRFRQRVRLNQVDEVLDECLGAQLPTAHWEETPRLPDFLARLNGRGSRNDV
jgi:(2Fe-2S) ferredoxin